jgi:hypothetical protein
VSAKATPAWGKWGRVAERLGLTVVTSGRLAKRVRCLVGFHGGFLLAIAPASSFRTSSVEILVRFPRNSTVRGFWDDIVNDASLAGAFGRRRRLPRSRRKDLLVGDGSLLFRLTYDMFPPRANRIERVTKALVEALSHHMRPLERVCELCSHERDPGIYLADGVPALVCARCLEAYLEHERDFADKVRAIPPDLGRGTALGVGAALAFGIAGGALASVPNILLPSIGSVVGLPILAAVGFAVSLFMSRGFSGFSVGSTFAKLPVVLLGGLAAYTTANAVTTMTVLPEPVGLLLLWRSSVVAALASPSSAVLAAGASLAGWATELVTFLVSLRRRTRMTTVEQVTLSL